MTADEFTDVAALVGYAVWQIQVLQRVLASYLVMVHKLQLGAARTEVETMFDKLGSKLLDSFSELSRMKAERLQRFFRDWSSS